MDALPYGFMIVDQDDSFFAKLVLPLMGRLRYLVSVSCGEQTIDDLKAEAWLAAYDIREEEGVEFEPTDAAFQQAVFFRLMKKFGKYANRHMRFAVRLDEESRSDDGDSMPNPVARSLASPQAYEPETALMEAERRAELQSRLARYTEAVAYLGVLDHFGGDLSAMAKHLVLSTKTVRTYLSRAAVFSEQQSSLFDGIERLRDDFVPARGRLFRVVRVGVRPWVRVCILKRPLQLRLFSSLPLIFGAQ
jgi:hypothetical protein